MSYGVSLPCNGCCRHNRTHAAADLPTDLRPGSRLFVLVTPRCTQLIARAGVRWRTDKLEQTAQPLSMTEADYRAMASEIRELIPSLLHSQSVADLRLLADRYERLGALSRRVPGTLPEALARLVGWSVTLTQLAQRICAAHSAGKRRLK